MLCLLAFWSLSCTPFNTITLLFINMLPMKNYKALFLSIILLVFSTGIISADEYNRFPPPQSLFFGVISPPWNNTECPKIATVPSVPLSGKH